MAFHINNDEIDRLARDLADRTGESLTQVILTALRERLERVAERSTGQNLREGIRRIQARVAALEPLDARTDDEILGFDERDLPS